MEPMKQRIVIIDFETGGTLPQHPNIQLAAIAVDEEWNEVDHFESKITFNPADCDPKALELNHFDGNAWHDAPRSDEVFAKFCGFLKNHATMEMRSKRTGNPYKVARIAAYNKDRLLGMADGSFVYRDSD